MNIFSIQKYSIKIIFILLIWGCTPVQVEPPRETEKSIVPAAVAVKDETSLLPKQESGLPESLSTKQFYTQVPIPNKETIAELILKKADETFLQHFKQDQFTGKTYSVPDTYPTIQAAINVSSPGDTIVVQPGIYYEQLHIKKGIRLISASPDGTLSEKVTGAILTLPKRTLQTIIDGSKLSPSPMGLLDFEIGAGNNTLIDGFTIQNLPVQNHHIPGHAHAINLRGASPVIMNCLVQNNGSTGIGSHVIYNDQDNSLEERDFRKANIKSKASALLYRNIVRNNLGRGLGCNHFSSPVILGNEVYGNDDSSLGESPGPGIGIKHGASPLVLGNIVHSNPGGGILIKKGASQGTYPVDRNPTPTIQDNLIFKNGTSRPALSCQTCGSARQPIKFIGNFIFDFGGVGIGIGKHSYGTIQNNFLANGQFTGIAVNGSTAFQVNDNIIAHMGNSAFTFVNRATIKELNANRVFGITNTPFMIQGSSIENEEMN